ncbi:MAG: ATP-binding protein, partial [Caldilineaceae bacterium]|nr:ATP-binding protein [Caldilineaceae bacterium]
VTDLNWLAETDQGELQLTLEACSLNELLAAEVERWQPQAQAQQVALSLEADADLPEMTLDRMRMGQALGNVLNNAIRCSEAAGRVVVRAKLEGEEAATIAVIDDGVGIEADDLPHVFERFYRTDQSQRHGIGGTGLGLAIARAVAEAHGGTVAIDSDGPGQGAAVTFRLPLDR